MFDWLLNLFKGADNSALIAVLKDKQTVVIDVRTRGEFAVGNVANSFNIPLDEIPKNVEKIKKMGKPVVFCCASGNRSGQATRILKQNGLENVYNGGSYNNVNNLKNS